MVSPFVFVALNPQPIPPGRPTFGAQTAASFVMLNPQPLPPRVQAGMSIVGGYSR